MSEVKERKPGASPRNGCPPPKNRQFGQPGGNPRHNGAWKKEDTLRYKWEQMLKLDDDELRAVLEDTTASKVERITAEVLLDGSMKSSEKLVALEKLANQVYGFPKQEIKQTNIEAPAPRLPKTKSEE